MFRRKSNPANYNTNTKKKSNMLKKVAIMTCICLSFTLTTAYADDGGNVLETIFHVYVDGKQVGKVDDKKIVQDLIDEKIASESKDFEKFSMTIGEKVSFVSERVFNPAYNNDKVTIFLDDNLTVKAAAVELKIGDKTVGVFKDEDTANQVLTAYQEKYVDPAVLKKLTEEKQKSDNSDNKEKLLLNEKLDQLTLAVGDSIIKDVQLSEKISFSDEKAKPTKILTKKQGLKMLERGTLEEKVHKVDKGEVLGNIADQYDLSVEKLLELNKGLTEKSLLQINQEINVTDYKPFVDVIVKKEKLEEETIDYKIELKKSDDMFKGDKKVKQEGQEGKKEVHYTLELKNGDVINKEIVKETTTKEPVKEIIIKGTKVVPSRGTGQLHWPTIGGYVSSGVGMRWGSMHKGMDIAGPSNRAIVSADNGTVVSAGWDSGGYGNKVVINHNNGMKTVYAHLSSISVSSGQTVEKGTRIGTMGTTGNSTGIHLHFELYKNGALQNPQNYF